MGRVHFEKERNSVAVEKAKYRSVENLRLIAVQVFEVDNYSAMEEG